LDVAGWFALNVDHIQVKDAGVAGGKGLFSKIVKSENVISTKDMIRVRIAKMFKI